MAFFRQYIAPLIVVLIFVASLIVVSARIFLPSDMAAPAPTAGIGQASQGIGVADLPPALSSLVKGLPDAPDLVERF